jgi:type IV pilus assembly protein PilE
MRRVKGFTLIEVMITVAIVAILAAIALPSYTEYVRRARISDGISILSAFRLKMEQYFQDNRGYALACRANTVAPIPDPTAYFTFDCNPAPDDTTFRLRAIGIGSMTGFVYTIDQANVKTSTGPAGWAPSSSCWVLRRDGSC